MRVCEIESMCVYMCECVCVCVCVCPSNAAVIRDQGRVSEVASLSNSVVKDERG